MSVELHRADPRFRRMAPWLLFGTAAIGGVAVWALRRWLSGHLGAADLDGLIIAAAGLVVILASISLGLAWAFWRESSAILREDSYPPSDMRTLRDVEVKHGSEARRAAFWMKCGAIAAAAAGLGIVAWGYRLLQLVR